MNDTWVRRFRFAYGAFSALTLLNFVVFVATAFYLGGDAVNGKAEGGRYYLFGVRTESGRKVYTEVSESVFNYSKWHVYSIFASWPLMLAGATVGHRIGRRWYGRN